LVVSISVARGHGERSAGCPSAVVEVESAATDVLAGAVGAKVRET